MVTGDKNTAGVGVDYDNRNTMKTAILQFDMWYTTQWWHKEEYGT